MNLNSEQITIHQVLHGYDEGHRCLASSLSFSKSAERLILALSDLSGQGLVSGFECYLTGYPIPDNDQYALAKTWYADDMKRPGCVWTHTLILSKDIQSKIDNLILLNDYFKRPINSKNNFDLYNKPIVFNDNSPYCFPSQIDRAAAREILLRLYGSNKPVFLLAEDSHLYESLVLSIWNQQWPFLRKSFSFCTGSIRSRDMFGNTFDLQVIPPIARREVQRAVQNAEIVDITDANNRMKNPISVNYSNDWINSVLDNLCESSQSKLKQYFASYISDLNIGRPVYPSYVRAYDAIEKTRLGGLKIKELIDFIADIFPGKMDACELKIGLFGKSEKRKLIDNTQEIKILRELVFSQRPEAYDANLLEISERIAQAWPECQWEIEAIIDNIAGQKPNLLSEAVINGLASAISIDQVLEYSRTQIKRHIANALVAANPSLTAHPEIWRSGVDEQRNYIDALSKNDISLEIKASIVKAQLIAGVDIAARATALWLKDQIVDILLQLLSSDELISCFSRNWCNILASDPQKVIKWLEVESNAPYMSIKLITEILNPHAIEARNSNLEIWHNFTLRTINEKDYLYESTSSMAFILIIALYNSAKLAPEITANAFPIVYKHAESNKLGFDAWRALSTMLPDQGWWWDNCDRLRRGLLMKFTEFDWPTGIFLKCTADANILKKILSSWGWQNSEKKYLRRVINDAIKGDIPATSEQLQILEEYAKWF